MTLTFTKVHGAGNDFVVFKFPQQPDEYFSRIAPALCDRRKGIGADGILLVREEKGYDFRMVYFNSDGSRAEFCGNGGRSLVLFAWTERIAKDTMKFVSDVGEHTGLVREGKPSVSLPDPSGMELDIDIAGLPSPIHFVNTGVPHAVVFVEQIDDVDVAETGRRIRFHERLAPQGTNADFVEIGRDGKVRVRTYERGVEAETLACGTGAVAVAAVLHSIRGSSPPVELSFPGGLLVVNFDETGDGITNVMLGGETAIVFKGEIEIS